MKRMIINFLVVMTGFAPMVTAQEKNVQKQPTTKQQTAATGVEPGAVAAFTDTVTLLSVSSNAAFSSYFGRRFFIADPTVNALKLQAYGVTPIVSPSGVVGMPKRAYGFSNGKILLRNTTAPTAGTMYGSGAVGTGTSLLGLGAGERAIGVNGKNPYSATWLWGSKQPLRGLPPEYRSDSNLWTNQERRRQD